MEGEDWWWLRRQGGQRPQQWRCGRVPVGMGMGRTKNERASRHKTGAMSRISGSTSRRSRMWSSQRRDVEIQRCDVTERIQIQRHDVRIQRRDVPERL